MTRRAIALTGVIATATIWPSLAGATDPVAHTRSELYLSASSARQATRQGMDIVMAGFTERPYTVRWGKCRRVSRARVNCRLSFQGDRLSGSMTSHIIRRSDTYDVRFFRVTAASPEASDQASGTTR